MQLKISQAIAVTAFMAFAFNAHAADVKTDYNHKADFAGVHTYSWGEVKTADPFYQDRIKQEIDKDLQAKGWQSVPSGGDVTIFAHGSIQNEKELETYYNGFGGGWGGRWGWGGWGRPWMGDTTTTVTDRPTGMLVVDIFNGQSKDLMWRGSSHDDIAKKADKNTRNLDKDIDEMFKKFPPKK